MTGNITTMNRQWATRPADETHWDWQSALARASREQEASREWDLLLEPSVVSIPVSGDDILVDSVPLGYTGFQTVADCAGAPAGYLATLPTALAQSALRYGLSRREPITRRAYSVDGAILALTSERYTRDGSVGNVELVRILQELAERTGLTAAEHFRTASQSGDGKSHPLGYLGGGTCVFCLVDYARPVQFNGRTLCRGIIVENNILGKGAAKCTMFLFDTVCANFIIRGAEILSETSVRHMGKADASYRMALSAVDSALMLPESSTVDSLRGSARLLGDDRAGVAQHVYSLRNPLLGKKLVGEAYDRASLGGSYGDPRSAWAIVGGLTELSQERCTHAADRLALDRAAGALLGGVRGV